VHRLKPAYEPSEDDREVIAAIVAEYFGGRQDALGPLE